MNIEDRKRFARYYPGYIETLEEIEILNKIDNQVKKIDNQVKEEKELNDKKNILGYIEKINIDKNKLIIDTIINYNANNNL